MGNLEVIIGYMAKIGVKKVNEFALFVQIIRSGGGGHLGKVAEMLHVAPETLSDWVKKPEIIQARAESVNLALQKMRAAGESDWRMWDKILDRSGLVVQSKLDMTTNGKDIPSPILNGISKNVPDNDSNEQIGEATQAN